MGVSHEAPIIRVLAFLCSALVVVMIRLRIDRSLEDDWDRNSFREGIVWYEDGKPVGRVIIEQTETMGPFGDHLDPEWEPVEVVE